MCNYTGTHTLQIGTQQRCFAPGIGMLVVLPRTSSFTMSSSTTMYVASVLIYSALVKVDCS